MPYWVALIKDAPGDHYIFSRDLMPGEFQIRREQLTRRWNVHVKKKLGINQDLYSLKHTNLDEVAKALDLQAASSMAGHTSTIVTMKYYTSGEKGRQDDRLKRVSNEL